MPFGLYNAPGTFQSYINDALRDFLDDFVSAYLDNALVFLDNEEAYHQYVEKVMKKLLDAGLQLDINKCEFYVQETKYLGLIIGKDRMRIDPEKVAAIQEWEAPKNVKDVLSFLRFANFYRRFICNFSSIALPMT